MVRTALAQDLRYLHESLKRQRVMNPVTSGLEVFEQSYPDLTPGRKDAYYKRLREPARLRSFEEHTEAIVGLPLDAVQLLFRSELPVDEIERHQSTAAAIIKAQHDLHFWEPLETLGISQSFHLHRKALEDDLEIIQANCPPVESAVLHAAWTKSVTRLKKALGVTD
jgi:hypothetical protein